MAVLNRAGRWLFLAEGFCASRATHHALMQIPGSEQCGGHHETWPSLIACGKLESIDDLRTFSFVRHPLDVIATLVAKGSCHPVKFWLMRYFHKRRDGFFCHRAGTRLFYENGIHDEIVRFLGIKIPLEVMHVTAKKRHWKDIFTDEDFKFARATIPELFDHGYLPWETKRLVRQADIDNYTMGYGL